MSQADAFRAAMVAADSITLAMAAWCGAQSIGTLPLHSHVHTRADISDLPKGVPLGCPGETVFYRRITLMAGDVPLLDADNWFLPGRLPDRAADLLLSTDAPFGTVLTQGHQTRVTEKIIVPPGAAPLDRGEIERDDVPLLTLRGRVALDGVIVSFVEERFRLDVLG